MTPDGLKCLRLLGWLKMRRKAAFGQNKSEMRLNEKLGDAFVNHKDDCQLGGELLIREKKENEYTLSAYHALSFNFQNGISTSMDKKVGLREFRLLSKVKLQKWMMESVLNPLPSDSAIYLLFY